MEKLQKFKRVFWVNLRWAHNKKQFLQFKTITLVPIDSRLIDFKMLTYPEKKWLRNYHCKVFDLLKDGLNEEEKTWLSRVVARFNSDFSGLKNDNF